MRRWFSALVFAVIFIGCSPIVYCAHPAPVVQTKIIAIQVDKTFTADNKKWIADAVREWNLTLNGYMRFDIVSYNFDMQPEELKKDELFIMKVKSDSDLIPIAHSNTGMAWINTLGGKWMWVIEDRIYQERMIGVVMHELGHHLGVEHLSRQSLMY